MKGEKPLFFPLILNKKFGSENAAKRKYGGETKRKENMKA
jgi:hypothetical protein